MKTKYYAVSFGDSRKYKVSEEDLHRYAEEIREYVSYEFAGEDDSYYVTPHVRECRSDADYPWLTHVELEKIKSDIRRQIEVKDYDRELNLNTAFSA